MLSLFLLLFQQRPAGPPLSFCYHLGGQGLHCRLRKSFPGLKTDYSRSSQTGSRRSKTPPSASPAPVHLSQRVAKRIPCEGSYPSPASRGGGTPGSRCQGFKSADGAPQRKLPGLTLNTQGASAPGSARDHGHTRAFLMGKCWGSREASLSSCPTHEGRVSAGCPSFISQYPVVGVFQKKAGGGVIFKGSSG